MRPAVSGADPAWDGWRRTVSFAADMGRKTSDHRALWALAFEMLVWWHEAGRHFYACEGPERDDGLRGLVADAVRALGGWRAARQWLVLANVKSLGDYVRRTRAARPPRALRIREEGE